MKVVCFLLIFFCLFALLYVLLLITRLAADADQSDQAPPEKHYLCPSDYLLRYNSDSPSERPVCVHPLQLMIEAEQRQKAEQRAKVELWLKKHPWTTTTRRPWPMMDIILRRTTSKSTPMELNNI